VSVITKPQSRLKRRRRVRAKVAGTAERPRVSVFRSNRGICAQLIDDVSGRTLAAVNWYAKAAGVSEAVFDRGGYRYHGHVRAFAEAIREGGITV